MAMTDTLEHVTTSVARRVREGHEADFVEWTDRGIDLVRTFPGFLGGGWLRSSAESSDYHVVYRFETHDISRRGCVRRRGAIGSAAADR
jgi:antibiotic biosynthesis monooxygenase (ABM) superfamily enzyme